MPGRPGEVSRRLRATVALPTVLALLAVLAGCGASVARVPAPATTPAGPTATAAAPAAPPEAPADAATVRTRGVPLVAGGVTVLHALAVDGTTVTVGADGDQAVLTLAAAEAAEAEVDAAAPVDALLAVPDGADAEVLADGSVVVTSSDGSPLGGSAPPSVDAGVPPARTTTAGDGLVRVRADGPVTVRVGAVALLSTDWGEREGGRSLAVEPSAWARGAGLAGEAAVWAELVAAEPEADTPVMRDQLACHAVGARDKATWNLEPWRPDVGLLRVMLARCNPT